MNPSIQGKLERLAERFTEITALMAEPEVQGDQARFRALGQEGQHLLRRLAGLQAAEGLGENLVTETFGVVAVALDQVGGIERA